MSDLPDLREQIAALFRSAPGETRLGDEPPGLIADAVLTVLPEGWDRFVRTIQVLRDQVAAAEASRRDWAAEALRLQQAVDSVAADYDELAAKADLKIGEHSDALMAWGCWRNAAKKLRSASVHPEGGGS